MLEFEPETEEELANLAEDGDYPFMVVKSEPHVKKENGNKSIKLTLKFFDNKNKERIVFCYLSVAFKKLLKHFCDATGNEDAYKSGKVSAATCENMSGIFKIGRSIPEEGSNYSPQNVVIDFIKRDPNQKAPEEKKNDFINDDILF